MEDERPSLNGGEKEKLLEAVRSIQKMRDRSYGEVGINALLTDLGSLVQSLRAILHGWVEDLEAVSSQNERYQREYVDE